MTKTHTIHSVDTELPMVLLDEKQAPSDIVDEIGKTVAGQVIRIHTMQAEATGDPEKIFNSVISAHERHVDAKVLLDRFARTHIRSGESQAYLYRGRTIYHIGNKEALKEDNGKRERLFETLGKLGILDPNYHKRGKNKILSHDHSKIDIVGDVAYVGTMNMRAMDSEISNFMMKITDSRIVNTIKEVSVQIENGTLSKDSVTEFKSPDHQSKIELLVDAGNKRQSIIYDRAITMTESMQPADKFISISQWPPNTIMSGRPLLSRLRAKIGQGTSGTFLMSPAENLNPIAGFGRWLKKRAEKKYGSELSVNVKSLARQTHIKALVIKRADGRREVLFGSHNLTKRTVKNGTRETSMWTDDPAVVDQVIVFLDKLEQE